VRERGDAALYDLSERFDYVDLREKGLRVAPDEIKAAPKRMLLKFVFQAFAQGRFCLSPGNQHIVK
jgi:histidinol dehydrogenase